ncbi:hypothetical protein CHL78_000900 [Romboutsia weinsteinii]|uniref:DUF3168 domain-containing protein n=1 Tax=Romboutsia weinsteinii TaxID=2020949 RepID=A0A371JAG1_9FIRM|nr:hypothetical protein [Romboutsia weinsteinii]RDY29760.1 hypothetical protein CHL78_000900 [Romboutsia weinsteinii]
MINSKIIETLQPLNIPIHWMEYSGDNEEYLIFQTNNQDDINYSDDIASNENIEIGLIYWFKSPAGASKIDEIKRLMKEEKFIKLNERDMKSDDFYGRSFRYRLVKDL